MQLVLHIFAMPSNDASLVDWLPFSRISYGSALPHLTRPEILSSAATSVTIPAIRTASMNDDITMMADPAGQCQWQLGLQEHSDGFPTNSGNPHSRFGRIDITRRRQQNRKSAQASRSRRSHQITSMKEDVLNLSGRNKALQSERAALLCLQHRLRFQLEGIHKLVKAQLGLDATNLLDEVPAATTAATVTRREAEGASVGVSR